MLKLALLAFLALTPIQDDTYLYKVTLIRAAPGHLLDVIDAYRDRVPVYDAAGEQRPVMIRHSQGDHWDLMVIEPVQSLPAYYASDRVARRVSAGEAAGASPHEFDARLQQIISWKEETFFSGVPVQEFRRLFDAANYFHVEMFVALPGKGQELHEERVMENEYLRRIGRPQNLIFAKALGGSWDSFTLGFYRDIKHFAESADTPADLQQEAAVAAGFEGADKIGTYLRELISRHNDTLAGKVLLW
ncbi:MAG: hypothetical protein IH798_06370 [Gemmatimonadetes bacterium]|nr:hypothetical protein [Gemmatimonadota bacterium]